jgi:hypothetical protein
MTPGEQSSLVFWVTVLLYIGAGIWLISKGWMLRAGIVMGGISILPFIWQISFAASEAPGAVILSSMLLSLSLLLVALGLIITIVRFIRTRREVHKQAPKS